MRGALTHCLMEATLMFSLVTIAYFALLFDMTTTFHMTEKMLADVRLPYMQSLSYSTAHDTACEGNPRLYNLMISAIIADTTTPKVCGEDYSVEGLVEGKWSRFTLDYLRGCYYFSLMKHNSGEALFTAGDCAGFDKTKTEALSRHYLIPLPLDEEGNPRLTREKITKVDTDWKLRKRIEEATEVTRSE